MEIFSEIYNCYYQIMKSLLQTSTPLTLSDIQTEVQNAGYEESLLYLVPKLTTGEWKLFHRNGDFYISKIAKDFYIPLTNLQTSYIKTILQDKRIQLFFSPKELKGLENLFSNVTPLWTPDSFYYYDQFSNGDNYSDSLYQKHFRQLLSAIANKQVVDISYESRRNHRVHHHYLPCRLEYSIKNDKFRLLGMTKSGKSLKSLEILNLDRIQEITLLSEYVEKAPNISERIRSTYYKEPVKLHIHTDRNALERAMLQFANYEKNTTKINDTTYECLIYYNEKMETELLIEVLSFGPMLEVLGSERFLGQMKERLYKQKRLQDLLFNSSDLQ